jgi:hypothetical protein
MKRGKDRRNPSKPNRTDRIYRLIAQWHSGREVVCTTCFALVSKANEHDHKVWHETLGGGHGTAG